MVVITGLFIVESKFIILLFLIDVGVDSAEYWMREKGIRLQHVDTKLYLSSSKEFAFGHPISGQHEVAASKNAGKNEEWQTMEGIYFSDKNTD